MEDEDDNDGIVIHLGTSPFEHRVTVNGEEIPVTYVEIEAGVYDFPEATLHVLPDGVEAEIREADVTVIEDNEVDEG